MVDKYSTKIEVRKYKSTDIYMLVCLQVFAAAQCTQRYVYRPFGACLAQRPHRFPESVSLYILSCAKVKLICMQSQIILNFFCHIQFYIMRMSLSSRFCCFLVCFMEKILVWDFFFFLMLFQLIENAPLL